MRIKVIPVIISLFTAITVAALSGCNSAPPSPSTTPVPPGPVTSPKPGSTPVIDPNAPPAAYKLSNIRAEKAALEYGANEYYVFVDVQNTGGQPGNFSATFRIDNGPEILDDSKKLSLTPGQKKQLRLGRIEYEITRLGQAYDQGLIEEKQHAVFCGDLVLPITLADRPALALTSSQDEKGNGNITITGDVKNISDKQLDRVIAVVDLGFDNNTYQSFEGPVMYEPVLPNQSTPFRVIIPSTPGMEAHTVGFRILFKDAAGIPIRSVSTEKS